MTHDEPDTELAAVIATGLAGKDRQNMAPTVAYFRDVLDRWPGNPFALYEYGGALDTAGREEEAAGFYEQALAAGLSGDTLRRCLIQYGSTLRNLERHEESLTLLRRARAEFPESDAVRLFLALSLHAAGRTSRALAETLELVADRVDTPDVRRYEAALRGNAEYLAGLPD